jgi:hypothetical protein
MCDRKTIYEIFLLSSYEIWESIGFTSEKSKEIILPILTFYTIFRLSIATTAAGVRRNLSHAYNLPLKS